MGEACVCVGTGLGSGAGWASGVRRVRVLGLRCEAVAVGALATLRRRVGRGARSCELRALKAQHLSIRRGLELA